MELHCRCHRHSSLQALNSSGMWGPDLPGSEACLGAETAPYLDGGSIKVRPCDASDSLLTCAANRLPHNERAARLGWQAMEGKTQTSPEPHWLQRIVIGRNPSFTLLRIVVLVVTVAVVVKFVL